MISVIIPTVPGREEHLKRCIAAYEERTVSGVQIIVVRDKACCGDAWNEGAEQAEGSFLHWTADDLEPCVEWDRPAVETVLNGAIPAPIVYGPDGKIETCAGHWQPALPLADLTVTDNTSVVPFCSRKTWEDIGPHLPAHYYTDNYFTDRCRALGLAIQFRMGYAFKHHWASERRGAGADSERARLAIDREIYLAASGAGMV